MLFNDDVLFLHVPKTGGMSVTAYLLNNLPGRIYVVAEPGAEAATDRVLAFPDVKERVTQLVGGRHERLKEAAAYLEARGRRLDDFRLILTTIRDPYDLELSYFAHMRKPRVQSRYPAGALQLIHARNGDFDMFAAQAPFYGRLPSDLHEFFSIDGVRPAQLKLLRFENLAEDLRRAVSPYGLDRWGLPHLNASEDRGTAERLLTPAAEEAVFNKHRRLFSYYPRRSMG